MTEEVLYTVKAVHSLCKNSKLMKKVPKNEFICYLGNVEGGKLFTVTDRL